MPAAEKPCSRTPAKSTYDCHSRASKQFWRKAISRPAGAGVTVQVYKAGQTCPGKKQHAKELGSQCARILDTGELASCSSSRSEVSRSRAKRLEALIWASVGVSP